MSSLDEIRSRIPDVPRSLMSRAEQDRARLLAAVEAAFEDKKFYEACQKRHPDQPYEFGLATAAQEICESITTALEASE